MEAALEEALEVALDWASSNCNTYFSIKLLMGPFIVIGCAVVAMGVAALI